VILDSGAKMSKAEIVSGWVSRKRRLLLTLSQLFMIAFFGLLPFVVPVQGQTTRERKVVARVEPDYPDTLKRLYIGGVVRVQVEVEPSGTVKSTSLLGGNPVLGQSAMKAIKQWKFVPASTVETLTVRYEFDPHR
jgi:TonB family protein